MVTTVEVEIVFVFGINGFAISIMFAVIRLLWVLVAGIAVVFGVSLVFLRVAGFTAR